MILERCGESSSFHIPSIGCSTMAANTTQVRRVCTKPRAPKVSSCSMLYSACWRAWKAMGGTKMITYTLQSELGTSLKASGWKRVAKSKGHAVGKSWDTHPRRGKVAGTVTPQDKWRWEVSTAIRKK